MDRNIIILGSTGSIGRQTVEVCLELQIPISGLACHRQWEKLAEQIIIFHPHMVVVTDREAYQNLKEWMNNPAFIRAFKASEQRFWSRVDLPVLAFGEAALLDLVTLSEANCVVAAMVGFSGLAPVLKAIAAGKDIALANKETLVTAGQLVKEQVAKHKVQLLPVDSEHAAIWQCLQGGKLSDLSRIFLTASGGPFRTWSKEELAKVKISDALAHPTWSMGPKITIDSATLMNKGLEVIEAAALFQCRAEQIEVVVHPQSIVHSMIEWKDGSVLAQLGFPSMKLPIQQALTYPLRLPSRVQPYNPFIQSAAHLTFEQPRLRDFPLLQLSFEALRMGGLMPTVLNAANEIAVAAFLADKLSFLGIAEIVERIFTKYAKEEHTSSYDLRNIMDRDWEVRLLTKEYIKE